MPSWKKIITNSDGPDAIDGVGSSANKSNATQNNVLTFDGNDWVSAAPGSTFNFQWTSVNYNLDSVEEDADLTDTSPNSDRSERILMGTGVCSANLTCTIVAANAALDTKLSNFKVQMKEGTGNYADVISGTPTTLTSTECANSTSSLGLDYPASITQTNKLKCSWTHADSGAQDHEYTMSFGNYGYIGKDAADTLAQSSDVSTLSSRKLGSSGSTGSNHATTVPLTSTSQWIYLAYPSRITDTPGFNVGPNASSAAPDVTWTEQGSTVSVTNPEGFAEPYKVWRSPTKLSNVGGQQTWYISIIF